jgi:6-pyruvoyltetrahydropterin/6-carboxytetrahydropterin synthase
MYSLAVSRIFTASHFLIGGDWGAENQLHSHEYKVEILCEGPELNEHGYLLDIVHYNECIDARIEGLEHQTLNKMTEFKGLNPSIEHFARILFQSFRAELRFPGVEVVEVKLWEDDIAWTAYHGEN